MNDRDKLQNGRDGALRRPLKVRPIRKQLPHEVPNWVDLDEAVYFITICCQKRDINQLTKPDISRGLLRSIEYRHRKGDWDMHLALLNARPHPFHRFLFRKGEEHENSNQQVEGMDHKVSES